VAVAIRPDVPVALARSGVQHTWDSYRGSLIALIRSAEWEPALCRLAEAGVAVTLAEGSRDSVTVSGRAATLAAGLPGLAWAQHLGAGHQLPITDGAWCAAVVAGAGAARWLLRGQDAKSRCSAPSFDNHPPAQATAGRT